MFGDKYKHSLVEQFDASQNTKPVKTKKPVKKKTGSKKDIQKQENLLRQLGALGIPIKEV